METTVKQMVRDSTSLPVLGKMVMFMFATQIVVGQTLPILSSRPLNPVVLSLRNIISSEFIIVFSTVVASIIMFSLITRRLVFYSSLIYTGYTLFVSYAAFRVDPYIGVLYLVYAFVGIFLAASILEVKEDHALPSS